MRSVSLACLFMVWPALASADPALTHCYGLASAQKLKDSQLGAFLTKCKSDFEASARRECQQEARNLKLAAKDVTAHVNICLAGKLQAHYLAHEPRKGGGGL